MKQKLLTNTQINDYNYINYYKAYANLPKSPYRLIFTFLYEFFQQNTEIFNKTTCKFLFKFNFNIVNLNVKELEVANLVLKDLLNLNTI